MSIRHMARAIGSEHEVEAAAREAFGAYGRYWAEAFWVRPRRVPGILAHIDREGVERVEAARDAGSGMIFALPHIGNWEVAGTVAHDLGLELIAVAEALPENRIVQWFVRLRSHLGIDVVLANEANLMGLLGAALERRAAVALVMDRNVKELEEVAVLKVKNERVLRELSVLPLTQPLIGQVLSPTMALVPKRNLPRLRKALAELGFLLPPSADSAEDSG